MFDQIQDKLHSAQDSIQERFPREPDGRNEGIGSTENILAIGAAIAATFLARHALQAGWKSALDRDPPKNPASHDVRWKEALVWGAVSGAIVGMTRIASRRASSSIYRNYRA